MADPAKYDLNVILDPSLTEAQIQTEKDAVATQVERAAGSQATAPECYVARRVWVKRGAARAAGPVSDGNSLYGKRLCRQQCVVWPDFCKRAARVHYAEQMGRLR